MSLYSNNLDTIRECFGDGVLMVFDALFLGILAIIKMWQMDRFLTLLFLISMAFLMAVGTGFGKIMVKKREEQQQAFSFRIIILQKKGQKLIPSMPIRRKP